MDFTIINLKLKFPLHFQDDTFLNFNRIYHKYVQALSIFF